ncbi:uncharacterized protein LOC134830495 [Culicoides brevitarsis]|uniref:uncharacterized protein LOC134830495 n=1 Tax=Culicoides brevitarsis TaxID=469753 RepID=UPI00307CBCAF
MMAKEMLIVFLYDTELCTKEEDDPMSALLFFAPSWVGETRHMLVGQIMGVARFFRDTFGTAKIITLQSGRFALRFLGRYALVVGTDRNVDESILKYRSDLLVSLLRLYHKDVEKIKDNFPGDQVETRKKFTDKLYHIFDTYLPILQYNENIFNNIYLLDLPKSSANIYLDTIQTLQSCQQEPGVLGGQILYHNKVIASQLGNNLSKLLVLSDPLRLKTVDVIHTGFHVPYGVQLMSVFISSEDLRILRENVQNSQKSFMNTNPNLLPFTFSKRKPSLVTQKREKSLIFSNIPEEENGGGASSENKKSKMRPSHLPLKFKNNTSKEIPESGFSSINFDEFTDSFPEFIGQTSVCNTPMTENKILHGNVLSICSKTCEELERFDSIKKEEPVKMKNSKNAMGTPRKLKLSTKVTEPICVDIDEPPKVETKEKIEKKNDLPIDSYNYLHNPYKSTVRRNSWDSLAKIVKPIVPNKIHSDEWDSESEFVDDKESKPLKSITDPTFAAFNSSGDPISKHLYEEFFEFQYTFNKEHATKSSQKSFNKIDFLEEKQVKDKVPEEKPQKVAVEAVKDQKLPKSNKKGLSLPLKTWSQTSESTEKSKGFESSNKGLPLTPLMAKLTILALDTEREIDFEGNDSKPADETDIHNKKRRFSSSNSEQIDKICENLEKVDLFVCGQQNMTFMMLLEDGAAQKQKLVHTLFEICVSKLGKAEQQLQRALNINVEGADKGGEGNYSFITIDNQKLDTLQKSGPWSPSDLSTVKKMYYDLQMKKNISEMIIRKEENILYGFQCGNVEVFYQQPTAGSAGIPPPSDIFGNVTSVSRRRLERDHAIILL